MRRPNCAQKWAKLSVALALGLGVCACAPQTPPPAPDDWVVSEFAAEWTFDDDAVDALPTSWAVGETNAAGLPATWAVMKLPNAPSPPHAFGVLRSENRNQTYNVAIAERGIYGDLELSVAVKAISGEEDRGGGPIWRCINANNYYICRWNPLEENFRLYKVIRGKRTQLASAPAILDNADSAILGVTMRGDAITCTLNGEVLLEAIDDTLQEAGRVGLWTKADAATAFDNLTIVPLVE